MIQKLTAKATVKTEAENTANTTVPMTGTESAANIPTRGIKSQTMRKDRVKDAPLRTDVLRNEASGWLSKNGKENITTEVTEFHGVLISYSSSSVKLRGKDSFTPFNSVYRLDNPVIMGSGDIILSAGTTNFTVDGLNLAGPSPLKIMQHT